MSDDSSASDRSGGNSRFSVSCRVPVSRERLFAYHQAPGALERLIPPWEKVRLESSDRSLEPGSRVVLRTNLGPIPLRWVAEHGAYDPPRRFEDSQLSGPFAHWHHVHRFEPASMEDGSRKAVSSVTVGGAADRMGGARESALFDEVDYRLPGGWLGSAVAGGWVRRQLESMFRYRHRVTRDDLSLFERYRLPPLTVAVSGATGLVGSQLCGLLGLAGHQVIRLVRDPSQASDDARSLRTLTADRESSCISTTGGMADAKSPRVAVWSSSAEAARLNGIDAVVHLAGKSIGEGRWSAATKREIAESRVWPTRQLCESLARLPQPPQALLCASAIGIYGNRGDEWMDESSAPGHDFLADVGTAWEDACQPAVEAGIRVVHLRFGIVLSPRGGALAKLLLPFKLGLGGRLGSGRQWWSWIGIDDAISAIYHCLATPQLNGPVNLVTPHPATNAEFTRALGQVLRRPALLPAPAFALRLALGEMADALLLSSTRVRPNRLQETGFVFRDSDLVNCLSHLLGRSRR